MAKPFYPHVKPGSYMANPRKGYIPFVGRGGYTKQNQMWNPEPDPIWESVTGNPVSFETIKQWPLRQLKVAFSPVQSGTGDPSPDNVRPISGWSSLTVEQYGKNLINYNACVPGYIDDVTGNVRPQNNAYSTDFIPVYPSTDYAFTLSKTSGNWGAWYDSKKNWISGITFYGATDGVRKSPSNAAYMRMTLNYNNSNPNWQTNTQIEKGSAVTERVPYNGRSISISLGSTVYSGTVDVVTGVGEITWAAVDMGTLSWAYNSSTLMFNVIFPQAKYPDNNVPANALCERYKVFAYLSLPSQSVGLAFRNEGASSSIRVKDPSYTYPADFKTAMSGVMLVYELATPIHISLTPQEVQSLAGDNTMWTDAASLEVTYRSN